MSEVEQDDGPIIVEGPIGFQAKAARYGDVRAWERVIALDARVDLRRLQKIQPAVPMGLDSRVCWTEVVTDVSDGVAIAKRFIFGSARRVVKGQGPDREVVDSVAGRTYEASLVQGDAGSGLVVLRAGGAQPSADELKRVEPLARNLGQKPVFHRYAGGVEVEPGHALPIARQDAPAFFGLGAGFDVLAAEAVYRGAGKEDGRLVGYFDVTLDVVGTPSRGLSVETRISGLVAVDALTSVRAAMTLSGEVTLTGRKGLTTFEGAGTLSITGRSRIQ